jgi:hypothetical protein
MSKRDSLRAFGHDSIAHMNAARDNHRRRGTSGGKARGVRVTTQAMLRARDAHIGPGTWEHCLRDARARWEFARTDALEQFRFDVHGDEWAGF